MKIFWKNLKKDEDLNKVTSRASLRSGFTLLELLIVVVIVGTLVTIALPKYQNTLERGRALEGIRNVQYMAEYINAKHIATGEWPAPDSEDIIRLKGTDVIKSRFFRAPDFDDENKTVTISRNGDWAYSLTATINVNNGVVDSITCSYTGENDVCTELDLTGNLMNR